MSGFTSDDYCNRLRPYHADLAGAVDEAFRRWRRKVARHFPGCTLRGKRTILHELIQQEVRSRFDQQRGVRIIDTEKGHFLLVVNGTGEMPPIILRFKHLDDRKRTRNYPTKGAMKYDMQLSLRGIPKGVRLNIGYQLNEEESELVAILVTRAKGRRVLWDYPLSKTAEIVTFPQQANLPLTGSRRRAKPKDQSNKTKKRD